jgi:hypothetical protein
VPLGAMRGGGVRMLGRRPQGFLAGLCNHGCVGSVGGRPWLPVAADLGFPCPDPFVAGMVDRAPTGGLQRRGWGRLEVQERGGSGHGPDLVPAASGVSSVRRLAGLVVAARRGGRGSTPGLVFVMPRIVVVVVACCGTRWRWWRHVGAVEVVCACGFDLGRL